MRTIKAIAAGIRAIKKGIKDAKEFDKSLKQAGDMFPDGPRKIYPATPWPPPPDLPDIESLMPVPSVLLKGAANEIS